METGLYGGQAQSRADFNERDELRTLQADEHGGCLSEVGMPLFV